MRGKPDPVNMKKFNSKTDYGKMESGVSALLVLGSEGLTRNRFVVVQGPTGNSCDFYDHRNHPTNCNMFLQCSNHIEYEMR